MAGTLHEDHYIRYW